MANALTHDGQQQVLEIAFKGGTVLTTLDFGLTDAALSVVSDLADAEAGEVSAAGGYTRQTVTQDGTGFPTDAVSGGGWQLTSDDILFTATGADITPFSKVFLTDGTLLIAFWDVATTSIADGDTFTFVAKIKAT